MTRPVASDCGSAPRKRALPGAILRRKRLPPRYPLRLWIPWGKAMEAEAFPRRFDGKRGSHAPGQGEATRPRAAV